MGSSYQRVALDDPDHATASPVPSAVPHSPPPSFRSRESSRRPSRSNIDHEDDMNDAFDAPSDDENDDEARDQRRLLSRRDTLPLPQTENDSNPETASRPPVPHRTVTEIPVFVPTAAGARVVGGGSQANDGVWANLNAKPRPEDELEEKPPTYEQAAADATPPYWETTVFSPYASIGNPDDVFVDGLLVGSLFSFVWNALISMSFQLIGFLLTYLLHTTHAAKNGSRAGLGITLINYGFQMRYSNASHTPGDVGDIGAPQGPVEGVPDHPNAHNFDPSRVANGSDAANGHVSTADILSYVLMIVGWFILIRSVSDFMRARRQEALVRSSPDRGLGVAVVAEGETAESSV